MLAVGLDGGVAIQRRWLAQALAAPAGGVLALNSVLDDNLALELGHRAEHVIDQLAAGRGGVDPLAQRAEMNAVLLEPRQQVGQVQHRAAQPVELKHDQHVAGPQFG